MTMTGESNLKRFIVDAAELPERYPTHKHAPEFWEALGRAVATFGFLEEVLGKAIYSFTATRQAPDQELEVQYKKWLLALEHALYDSLGGLIDAYGNAVRKNTNATISNLDDLLGDLREAAAYRNVLCHGSWRLPDELGRSLPFFVNGRKEIFETPIDAAFLEQLRKHVAELTCSVINTVTHMGWKFPGSNGPGKAIW